jgi:hypothetical protein
MSHQNYGDVKEREMERKWKGLFTSGQLKAGCLRTLRQVNKERVNQVLLWKSYYMNILLVDYM